MTDGSTPPPQDNESLQLLIDKLGDADRTLYNETMLRSMKGDRTDVTSFSADLNAALLASGALCEIPFESGIDGRAGAMADASRAQVGVMPAAFDASNPEHRAEETKLRQRVAELEEDLERVHGKGRWMIQRHERLQSKCQLVKPEVADLVELVKVGVHGIRATHTKMGPVYTVVVPEKLAMAIDGQAYVLRAIMGEANDSRPEEVQRQPAAVDKV